MSGRLRAALAVVAVVPALVALPAGAEPGATVWVARYDGPGHFLDVADDLALSPDGATVFVTGLSDGRRGSGRYPLLWADYATVAYDAGTGDVRWVGRYDGPAHGWDSANEVAVSPDGQVVYVTGGSRGSGTGRDYATIAYGAATGARLWVARYDGPAHLLDSAVSVVVTPAGSRVIVSGWSFNGYTSAGNRLNVYATVAYDSATGEELWARRTDLSGRVNYAWASALSPDGSAVYVTGWGKGGGTLATAETVAYDTGTGAVLWAVRADGVTAAYAAAVSPDGGSLFVSGVAPGGLGTVAYDAATGEERWRAILTPPTGYGEAWSVAVSPDGVRVYVAGSAVWERSRGCFKDDYTTVAFNASTGEEQWVARYDGPGQGFDWPQAVATSPDGSKVYVTGESAGVGSVFACTEGAGDRTGQDYATVAYEAATGQQLWVERYDSPERGLYDSAHDVEVAPDGAVYVTGESHGGGYRDYATIRYGPS